MDQIEKYETQNLLCLIEDIDRDKLSFIINNFDTYKDLIGNFTNCKDSYKKITDDKAKKTILQNRLKNKSNEIIYKPAQRSFNGRMFSTTPSLQSMNKIIRHTIARDLYDDVDIVNCHPVILQAICEKMCIRTPNLDRYITERDYIIEEHKDYVEDPKTFFLSLINDGNRKFDDTESFAFNFYNEIKVIQKKIAEYRKDLYKTAKTHNPSNPYGTCINYFLCEIENKIIQCLYEYCKENKIKVGALCFDGMMIEKGIITDFIPLEQHIKKILGITIKLVIKPMNKHVELPELDELKNKDTNFVVEPVKDEDSYIWTNFYDEFKLPFKNRNQLNNLFIDRFPKVCALINWKSGYYVKKDIPNEYNTVPKNVFNKDNSFKYYHNDKIITITLKDLISETDITTYAKLVCRPLNIHSEYFNVWTPMIASEKCDSYDPVVIESLLDYFKEVICDNNHDNYRYLISWLRHIFKYPERKTGKVILLQGEQGCGKGSLPNFLIKCVFGTNASVMVNGFDKIIQKHNTILVNKLFVAIDELPTTQKTFFGTFDKLKGLITEPTIDIEPKGVDPYNVDNYINFMMLTNNEFSVRIEQGDRRYVALKVSDKFKGNHKYWNHMYNNVFTEEVGQHFFKFLYDMDDDDERLTSIDIIPETELRSRIQSYSISSLESYIRSIKNGEIRIARIDIKLKDGTTVPAVSKTSFNNAYKIWCSNNDETAIKPKMIASKLKEIKNKKITYYNMDGILPDNEENSDSDSENDISSDIESGSSSSL
jgi:hypothetical protein